MESLKAEIAKRKSNRTLKGWVKREDIERDREQEYLKVDEQESAEREAMMRRKQEAKMLEREAEHRTQLQVLERATERKLERLKQPASLPGETLADKQLRLEQACKADKQPSTDLSEAEIIDGTAYNSREFTEKAVEYETREENGELEVLRNEHPFLVEASSLSYLDKANIICIWYRITLTEAEGIMTTKEQRGTLREMKEATARLFQLIRTRKLHEKIMSRIVLVVRHCQIKNYVRAHNHYLELTIADERYWDSYETGCKMQAVYVNEETRRLIIQNLKRMLTQYQKLHPTDNTKTWL